MDLPVNEWKSYVLQKWSLIPKSIQVTISTAETLSDIFHHSSSLLQSEDEEFLKRLSASYLVRKDPDAPLFYREQGNRKFQEKDYVGAAVLYSKTCLEDIIRAQWHGYPERLQPKMMLRKAECLVALRRPQEASQTIHELESNFTAKPILAASQSLQKNLSHLKMKVQENLPETFPRALTKACEDLDLREENEQISSASSSVSLRTDSLKGRYLVATKDILPGQILVKEEAFVSVLNPGEMLQLQHCVDGQFDTRVTNADLYCHRCLKHTLATVPCNGCSYVKYCSQECLQQAWNLYHSVECSLGHLLLTLGIFCHVALRSTLSARFEEVGRGIRRPGSEVHNKDSCLLESKNLVKTLSSHLQGESEKNDKGVKMPVPGCDINGKYKNNYNAVFNLLPHTENHSPEHKFLCAFSVSVLCKQLAASRVEAPTTGLKPSTLDAAEALVLCPKLTLLGEAMLRHMLQLQCNAQAISSIQHTGSKENIIADSRQVCLATGIFPVVSLLNHSCSPNTSVSFLGTVATVRASQKIGKGQEILHCYGPHESRMGVAERQQKLRSQYFFDCCCPACEKEKCNFNARPRWEAFCCKVCRALLQGDEVLSCSNSSCTESVRQDRLIAQLKDLQQQIRMARKLLQNSKLEQTIQMLLGCRHDAESFLSEEHTVMGEIEDGLAQAYAALGDWQKSAIHLQKSLQVVEVHHGPSSVEMGHELFKLAQIFFNGFAIPEALNTIQRAEQVLLVHCDPRDDEIQELQKMKFCLLDLSPVPVEASV